jgi:CDP-6-deoxy-D-xylo-4-hexulose-3-dehydrase
MIAALRYTNNAKLRLNAGDEIIVPAVSWGTTYFPLSQYGLKLKFVDVDPFTLNFDLQALKDAISEKTRAVMAVNLLGNPNDFDAIKDLVNDKNIVLIEDNCESMGAKFGDRFAGTFGVVGSFSCFYSHHICTMEGGLIVTDDEELYHIMLSLRSHGWTRNLPLNSNLLTEARQDAFTNKFNFVLPGYNVRPLEMSGALGKMQLKKLPNIIAGRRKNAHYFKSLMCDHPKFRIQEELGESSWFGFSLILKERFCGQRTTILKRLEALGFECRPIVGGNFLNNDVMTYLDYEVHGTLENAEYLDKNGLFIGNHPYPIDQAIEVLTTI